MNQLPGWWERRIFSLEEYRTGAQLSLSEKRAIHEVGDIWKISLVDNIICPCRELLYRALEYLPEKYLHYMGHQKTWFHDEKYYLGVNLHHKPSNCEIEEDYFKYRNDIRFRIFYVLKWKENTILRDSIDADVRDLAREVFEKADAINFDQQKYANYFLNQSGEACVAHSSENSQLIVQYAA